MTQIVKSFGKLPASEIRPNGFNNQVTWEVLLPYLKQILAVGPNESIEGIEITSQGIKAQINKKS